MEHRGTTDHPAADALGRRVVRWFAGPMALTGALTVALLVTGTLLAVRLPSAPLLPVPAGPSTMLAAVAGLTVMFFLTELGQARIEVRSQAYSFSLSGVPLLLGLLYCPPHLLLAARLGAAVVAFVVQRVPPVKFAFNTASYLVDVGAVITLTHLLVGERSQLSLAAAGLCFVVLAMVDLLMSGLVLVVIRVNGGPVGRDDVVEVLVSAGAFVGLNTAIGLISAELLVSGSLGMVLLVGVAVVAALSYRAYLVLRRRHRSLQDLQDFIRLGEGAGDVTELARRLLPKVRDLLHAERAELTVPGGDDGPDTVLCVAEDGVLVVAEAATAAGTETLAVPVEAAATRGTLAVLDRLGDRTRFTDDDLALLRTLGGHLAVALHSVRLLEQLRYEATHDVLTGLANRALLADRLADLMGGLPEAGRVSVLLLDLDRFKEVNDAFGHHVGDRLLQVVAHRLVEAVPPGCTVGRLGGDEFVVVIPPSLHPENEALALAQRITRSLGQPVELSDAAVTTGACVGAAVAADGQDGADLLRHADTAMYAAKDARLPAVVYTDRLDEGRRERLALLVDMRAALDDDRFDLHFQPKLDIRSGVVTSVEALVRWQHPTLGPVSPAVFIPVAESTGLIEELTQTVLLKALRQCRRWRDAGHDIAVAVNLSARNVNDPQLPERVAAALALAGVPAHRLILEITESSVMGDPERTVPTLERLEAIGITLSLDDFGTGYSSLAYLQQLPVAELKIDRSFLLGLARQDDAKASRVLVRSIIGLGQSLGLRVVAEGVETVEILDELHGLGCDLAQGYLVSRPVPPAELVPAVERAGYRTARIAPVTLPTQSARAVLPRSSARQVVP
ncbi:bifunctional diguanylate cyclase/phosphodiesterase [uncultured Cellulomonas sp.]|uniref:putative bifunctional diguanylate cyclase/phosphodiesterase n=1 Tax=uncultured Cellulomonas sp. TaxID=189682 RepID=UPI002613B90F|nr:GGDEF domain-containing protein [uncultured Cellulomonas sp.]